jgi:hypothetical protein
MAVDVFSPSRSLPCCSRKNSIPLASSPAEYQLHFPFFILARVHFEAALSSGLSAGPRAGCKGPLSLANHFFGG